MATEVFLLSSRGVYPRIQTVLRAPWRFKFLTVFQMCMRWNQTSYTNFKLLIFTQIDWYMYIHHSENYNYNTSTAHTTVLHCTGYMIDTVWYFYMYIYLVSLLLCFIIYKVFLQGRERNGKGVHNKSKYSKCLWCV